MCGEISDWNSPFCGKERRYQISTAFGIPCDDSESLEYIIDRATKAGCSPRLLRAISSIKGGKPDDITVIVARIR